MAKIYIVLRLLVFIMSNVGMWELFRRKTRINICFLPSLTIAIQTSFLFVAGILNLLKEATILLWFIGIIYLCIVIIKDRNIQFLKEYLRVEYIFCAFTMVIMLIFVRRKIFIHYDNFSHWALVIKNMLRTNRYPNFQDNLIMFQSYPLGSATYIYYFSKIINKSEAFQMLAQIYMMTTCIMPVFIFGKKNKIAAFITVISFTNFFFVYNITVTNLLVDTLLPLVSMCALLFVYMYCGKVKEENQVSLYWMSAYLTQIIQIKNSGIYFVLIAVVWILYKGKGLFRNNYSERAVCVLLPFVSLILWQKHCKYVFYGSETSKHAMTVSNYKSVFGEKSIEDIKKICEAMMKFAITYKDVWFTFGIIAVAGIIVTCICKEYKIFWLKVFVLSFFLYLTYQLGMLGMYLFSMPQGEAAILASNVRYTKTILIAIIYIAMIIYVRILSFFEIKGYSIATAFIALLLPLIFLKISYGEIKIAFQNTNNSEEKKWMEQRKWIEQAKKENSISNGESYCILIKEKDSGYAYYLGRYIFQTNDIQTMIVENEYNMDGIVAKYIFVYDSENSVAQEWIQENYPEQAGNKVIIRGTE